MDFHLILLSFILGLSSCSSNNEVDFSNVYKEAYEYIQKDSINVGLKIAVSDSIIDLDRAWNLELEDYPVIKDELDQYRAKHGYKYFKPYYSFALHELHEDYKQHPQMILFFSQIENCTLRADLYMFNPQYQYRNDLYIWGECTEYLFIINKNMQIEKVLKRLVILN